MRYSRMSVCLFLLQEKAVLSGAAVPAVPVRLMGAVCGAQRRLQCPGAARTSLSAAWSRARHSGQGSLSLSLPAKRGSSEREGGKKRALHPSTAAFYCAEGVS